MKKLFISVGLAAAGTAGLYASILDPETKDWTVAATLRGFYDDNYTTSAQKRSSIGYQLTPSVTYNAPFQQTELGVRYAYGLFYFQDRSSRHQNPIDQTHDFSLWVDHAFNPRWDLTFSDTITVSQDPPLTDRASATVRRVDGNNLVNTATFGLHTDWTRLFSTLATYNVQYVRYDNRRMGTNGTPSLAGLLDRIDQTFGLEGQWKLSPTTEGKIGYQFEALNFIGQEHIAFDPITATFYDSRSRDSYSHYLYVGANHQFLENLNGMIKVGGEYTTYPNDPSGKSTFGPYADASLVYIYNPGSYAQVGFSESRNATDAVQVDSKGHITQDQESSVFYASINQPLTPKLSGSGTVHYQHSIYHDGAFNSKSSDFFSMGIDFSYAIAAHFSTDAGYDFDYLTSAADGHYNRNRIYLGLTVSY